MFFSVPFLSFITAVTANWLSCAIHKCSYVLILRLHWLNCIGNMLLTLRLFLIRSLIGRVFVEIGFFLLERDFLMLVTKLIAIATGSFFTIIFVLAGSALVESLLQYSLSFIDSAFWWWSPVATVDQNQPLPESLSGKGWENFGGVVPRQGRSLQRYWLMISLCSRFVVPLLVKIRQLCGKLKVSSLVGFLFNHLLRWYNRSQIR